MVETSTVYYKALSENSEIIEGDFAGADMNSAKSMLKAAGLRPVYIGPNKPKVSFWHTEIGPSKYALSTQDCQRFCETLSMMLRAGLKLEPALNSAQLVFKGDRTLNAFVSQIRYKIRLGQNFSDALSQEQFQFPKETISLVKSGESSADLTTILNSAAHELARQIELRSVLVSASVYPLFVLLVAVAAIIVLSTLVAPQLLELFVSFDAPTPGPISILAAIGQFLAEYGLWFASFSILAVFALMAAMRSNHIKNLVSQLLFFIPGIRTISSWQAAGRFATSLRLGRIAGSAEEELAQNAITASSIPLSQTQAKLCVQMLRQGSRLSDWMAKNKNFPDLILQLLKTAEQTGAYVPSLKIVELEADRVLKQAIEKISSVLAPALIVIVGGLIGSVVFSVFSSMNNLSSILT